MNEVLKNIYTRASVRRYKADKVPDEDIKEIIRAGFHAANGMNRQAIEFIVMENKNSIRKYNRKAIILFAEMMKASGQPNPMIDKMVDDPNADVFHGAPVLVFVYANPSVVTPVEDGSLAVGNMMLAAHSMGYGTCFIGFAAGLGNDQEFRKECNVPDGHKYLACMILGKPDGNVEKHSRSDVKVLNWVK
ncbi:MAG: nitroreductase family protein [Candidatus Methanoplasma sp.]|jgi:nitroreductase|nr:nitroreductase family protein [Candidatus Methanoplasma sp.]